MELTGKGLPCRGRTLPDIAGYTGRDGFGTWESREDIEDLYWDEMWERDVPRE